MTSAQPSPVTGQDFVILSTQDWDSLPTRKHRFARWWAEDGNRVLYIEQQMHWAGWLIDIRQQFSRAWRWLKGPRQVAPNLWVFTLPIVLPFFQMSGLLNRINNAFLRPVIKAQLRRLGFDALIFWTYTPHSSDFIGHLNEKAAVYECVDDFTASKGLVDARVIGRLERELVERVDLLITTHLALGEKLGGWAKRAEVVPNGVEVDHFAQTADPDFPVADAFADLSHPIIGYLGAIQYWIDLPLLARIARKHPDWTIALVGPASMMANMAALERLPNVVLTGRVPYEEVPRYVKAFDVCVNPYILDDVAEHCSPLKLYEYIATGKPTVSVDMPEAHKFADLIGIARSADEFVELVEQAVHSPDGRNADRMTEAQNHTWRGRYLAASAALATALKGKND